MHSSRRLYALDFDGVIINSVDECMNVTLELSQHEFLNNRLYDNYRNLFHKFRWLVNPASDYSLLDESIMTFLVKQKKSIEEEFLQLKSNSTKHQMEDMERAFFRARDALMTRNYTKWTESNSLTDFGKTIVGKYLKNICIITTKNKRAVESLLKHYRIKIPRVYTSIDYHNYGTKGKLLEAIMENENYQEAYFIDDSTLHLDSVSSINIHCFFANWGYGLNTNYKTFDKKEWSVLDAYCTGDRKEK